MGKLEGKTAVITGAARGIGAKIAELFVEEGARVMICDRLEQEGRAHAKTLGSAAIFQELDVTSEESWSRVAKQVVEQFGQIDILVNGAGVLDFGTLLEAPIETCYNILHVNLFGPFLGIRAIGPLMCASKSGSIVNIASAEAFSAANGLNVYVASKWGVRGLARVAALELGHQGVRVNTICPGGINTLMGNPEQVPAENMRPAFQRFPLQRMGEPEEVAKAALFLASEDSTYCCGAELAVDGGLAVGRYYNYLPGAPKRS